jgi:hypothetical protein
MSITVPIFVLMWIALPLIFSIAFFLWWRRLRHWSFALLSVATGLGVVGHVCSLLATNIPRFGKTEEQVATTQDILALAQASYIFYLVMGILLLIGAFGLITAARDDFLLDDATRKISGN